MDLRLLSTFQLVAATGSVSAAAQRQMITQPALSRQLQQLERSLGVQLFNRDKGRLTLTAAGRTFLESANQVLASAEAARRVASSLAAGRLEHLAVAAPTTTLSDVLAPFLSTLTAADPLITVEEAPHRVALDGLRSRIDLAIVTTPPPSAFRSRRIAELPIWAYVGNGHALSTSKELTIEQLAHHRLLLLDRTSRPRQLVDEALIDAGLGMPEVVECSHPQVAQALAAAGRGVAVLSDDPRFGMQPRRVVGVHGRLTLALYAAWSPHHHATNELELLIERLRAFCIERYDLDRAGRTA